MKFSASTVILGLASVAQAFRPINFVKHTGDNGRADQGFTLVQSLNSTTLQSDLYIRFESYRYKSSDLGWTALALGGRMEGALMFVAYGSPISNDGAITLSVRTADGHTPPVEPSQLGSGIVPEFEVNFARFEDYTGTYYSPPMQSKPSHVGIVEFIIRGYDRWAGAAVSNVSTHQPMIWSSNFKQDFNGDFSVERGIEMHQFGLGFGFLQVDLANALVEQPFFAKVDDLGGHKGVNEIAPPDAPTKEELAAGDAMIAAQASTTAPAVPEATEAPQTTTTEAAPEPTTTTLPPTAAADETPQPTTSLNPNPIEEPVHNHRQFSIRSVMWHLHGILMIAAFMGLYPLGAYLIRSPRPTAFNLHWTIQSLGSVSVGLGAIIGYVNSHSISITHQYAGIAIVVVLAAQLLLGWRHHVQFLTTKSKSWMSVVHVWVGRIVLPVAFLNIISGLRLRQYGWFTILLVVIVMVAQIVALYYYLLIAAKKNRRLDQGVGAPGGKEVMTGEDAEEYFQLAGDDDEFSDSDGEEQRGGAAGKRGKRDEEAERLRRLDKV